MRLSDQRVTLLITGSIAAYKSAELVRALIREGAQVRVAMTESATKFITPLTLQTLSRQPVTTDLFDPAQESQIGHIVLADDADIVVIAPATAETISKCAVGGADNVVTAVLLATKAPRLFVPAMNVNMWENSLTKRNVVVLTAQGAVFLEPDTGELACGWHGAGRFPEVERVVDEISRIVGEKPTDRAELSGASVIVTAGPTREYLDPIRFITNRSSGKMGYALARAARARGADVTLIAGPTALAAPAGVRTVQIETAEELRSTLLDAVVTKSASTRTIVFMAAAVMDYRAAQQSASKLKHDKETPVNFQMAPNPDILRELGETREALERQAGRPISLVGFCAETGSVEEMLATARKKFERKQVDFLVANLAADGFEKDTNRVWVLDGKGVSGEIGPASKDEIAGKILDLAGRGERRGKR